MPKQWVIVDGLTQDYKSNDPRRGFQIGEDCGGEWPKTVPTSNGGIQPAFPLVQLNRHHTMHCCGLLVLEGWVRRIPMGDIPTEIPNLAELIKDRLVKKYEDIDDRVLRKGMYLMATVAKGQWGFAELCKALGLKKLDSFINPNGSNVVTFYGGIIE